MRNSGFCIKRSLDNLGSQYFQFFDSFTVKQAETVPKSCGMGLRACQTIIGAWAVGAKGECSNENVGFRLGPNGFKYAVMQVIPSFIDLFAKGINSIQIESFQFIRVSQSLYNHCFWVL